MGKKLTVGLLLGTTKLGVIRAAIKIGMDQGTLVEGDTITTEVIDQIVSILEKIPIDDTIVAEANNVLKSLKKRGE
jgi:hypothetical protein